jgi:hypothetical protein
MALEGTGKARKRRALVREGGMRESTCDPTPVHSLSFPLTSALVLLSWPSGVIQVPEVHDPITISYPAYTPPATGDRRLGKLHWGRSERMASSQNFRGRRHAPANGHHGTGDRNRDSTEHSGPRRCCTVLLYYSAPLSTGTQSQSHQGITALGLAVDQSIHHRRILRYGTLQGR